jgi:DNA polymerase I-like protein with 3'-5' exonuclease and polymerase domains
LTAAKIANVPVKKVTKEQRRRAKAVNFGFLFGQGVEGFRGYAARQYGVHLTEDEAVEMHDAFLSTYTGIAAWQRETLRQVRQSGRCETPGGRVRIFDGNGRSAHQALAFVIQGAEAEIMLNALATMHPDIKAQGARLVHFIHDEVIIEVPEDAKVVSTVTQLAERHIADAFRRMFPKASVGDLVETRNVENWGEGR